MYRNWLTFLGFLLVLLSCSKKMDDRTVAQVGDYPISVDEFRLRYNFNPYLRGLKDGGAAKREVLIALLAEKILYLEADTSRLHSPELADLEKEYLKETMIEQLRRDSVEQTIRISADDLRQEFKKSIRRLQVTYIAVQDKGEALRLKKLVDSLGVFEPVVRAYMDARGWQNETIPVKTVEWGKEPFALEDSLFKMQEGQVSNLIAANGEYYLVKVQRVSIVAAPSLAEMQRRRPALEDRLRRKKIRRRYAVFFDRTVRPQLPDFDWPGIQKVLSVLVDQIDFSQRPVSDKSGFENLPLKREVVVSAEERMRELGKQTAVIFKDGSQWTFRELLKQLQLGPYSFSYKSEQAFRRSFAVNIGLMGEYEAIYQLAKDRGYDSKGSVLEEFAMWQSYYRSNAKRFEIIRLGENKPDKVGEKAGSASFRLHTIDQFLSKKCEKYTIKINYPVYENLQLQKQDMVIAKRHFAKRLVAPPLEPLFGLPKWRACVKRILNRNPK